MIKLAFKLEENVSLFNKILDSLPIPAVLFNEDHELIHINNEFIEWFMINDLSNDHKSFKDKIDELLSNELNAILDDVGSHNDNYKKDILIRTKTKHHENCLASCKRLILVDGLDGLILFFQNKEEPEKELLYYKEKAHFDNLTQILNRFGFYEAIENTVLEHSFGQQMSAIVLGDLDNLKKINDIHGHSFGDKAIKSAVKGMTMSLRDNDIIARWGGDEFIILLTNVYSLNHVNKLMKRITVNVKACSHENKVPISISLGAALWKEDGNNLHDLIEVADKRMYKQKSINRFLN